MATSTPQYFEERRHTLLRPFKPEGRKIIQQNLDDLDMVSAETFVDFEGREMSVRQMINILHGRRNGKSQEEMHVLVHPEFPFEPWVMERFKEHIQRTTGFAKNFADIIAEGARYSFGSDIQRIVDENRNLIFVTCIQGKGISYNDAGIVVPSEEMTGDETGKQATGYLSADILALLFERYGVQLLDKKLRIDGTTFAMCPDQTAMQFLMARELGIVIDGKVLDDSFDAVRNVQNGLYVGDMAVPSGIARGVQLDCFALLDEWAARPSKAKVYGTLSDRQTLVYPTTKSMSMPISPSAQ